MKYITKWNKSDEQRREGMHIKSEKYGFIRVAKEYVTDIICLQCKKPIYNQSLKINGNTYHYNCFPKCVE
jgi:hypothetical protein